MNKQILDQIAAIKRASAEATMDDFPGTRADGLREFQRICTPGIIGQIIAAFEGMTLVTLHQQIVRMNEAMREIEVEVQKLTAQRSDADEQAMESEANTSRIRDNI